MFMTIYQRPANSMVASVAVVGLVACAGDEPRMLDVTISQLDTLVASGTGLFQQPHEITLGPDGQLIVTDALASTIFVFNENGETLTEIGRSGSGPAEFNGPRSVTLVRDTLLVVDAGNARLQRMTVDGAFGSPRSLPPAALRGAASISPSGDMLIGRNGRDSALAVLVDASGTQIRRLGDPPAVLPARFDFVAVKREIRDGKIPAMLRAITLPVLADDRSAWLVLVGEGEVRRYSPSGDHLWTTRLQGPEIDSVRAEFFKRNREDDDPNRFVTLNYVAAAKTYGENLWLLLRMPEDEGAVFVVLDADGDVAAHVRIPVAIGIRSFVLDPEERELYLLDLYGGAVLRVSLHALRRWARAH